VKPWRLVGLSVLLLGAALHFAGATPPPEQEEDVVTRTLDELKSLGTTTFTVVGETTPSPIGKTACAWFEWVVGDRVADPGPEATEEERKQWLRSGGWRSYQNGTHSERPVTVNAEGGETEVSWRKLRLHLAPTTVQVFTSADDAAPWAKEWLKENGAPATVAEYCLQPDRTYYGQVKTETYWLPPEPPDFEPGQGHNDVLVLSEEPFDERGKSPLPLTPMYSSWSY
jgi:hypothetical protein